MKKLFLTAPLAALDDGALDEVGVRGHEAYEFVVGDFARAEAQLAVDGLALPQQFARRDAQLADQLPQIRLAYRIDEVVALLLINPALP